MSLNRCEQRTFDYIQSQVDEGHFWKEKVQKISSSAPGDHQAATVLEMELWRYHVERSAVVASFREGAPAGGWQRTSMRNLAELLLRLWTQPKPKRKPGAENHPAAGDF